MDTDQFIKMQSSWISRFFDRVAQLVLVNFVMLLVSLCGLGVFGLYPAAFAGSAYFNDCMEGVEKKKFPAIFAAFKRYFWKANALMVVTVLTAILGYFMVFGMELSMFVYLLIMTWIIIVFIVNMYLPAVCILYPEFSFGKQLVFCMVAASTKWKATAILTAARFGVLCALLLLPQFGFFVFLSLMPWLDILVLKKAMRPETIWKPEED